MIFALFFLCFSASILHAETVPDGEYTVGPEDELEIKVWDNEDLEHIVEVSLHGYISFPLIGRVQAAGLTVFELEKLMEKKLAEGGYLLSPKVTVRIESFRSRKAYIFGEVEEPGAYVIKCNTHILELVTMAEGFTDEAGKTIKIVRFKSHRNNDNHDASGKDKEKEIITIDLSEFHSNSKLEKYLISSGDSVYVNKAERIYVTGAVNYPGSKRWEKGLTVQQAISMAGGRTEMASPKRVHIKRIKNGKEKTYNAEMDNFVQPDDIINVPERYF